MSQTSQAYHSAFSDFNSQSESHDNCNLTSKPNNPRIFTLAEIKVATQDFRWHSKVDENGIWDEYIGSIPDLEYPYDSIPVIVKRPKQPWPGDKHQWLTEINILGLVTHPNLVNLLGYCIEGDEPLLVYEYMPNGSVYDNLYTRLPKIAPSWTMRLKVAQYVARGLAYLHEEVNSPIIFGDLRSSNILLDGKCTAKLPAFGSSRFGFKGHSHVPPTKRTTGYEPKEYMATGCLSTKSDVWSYGIFLYELITGKRPLDSKPSQNPRLLERVKLFRRSKNIKLLIDSRLGSNYSLKSAQSYWL